MGLDSVVVSNKATQYSKDDLLIGWLSVAESQICSLEVLSSQLPEARKILEENMESLGEDFGELAGQLAKQRRMFSEISDLVVKNSVSEALSVLLEDTKAGFDKMNDSVMNVVVGMQFQDRVSQYLVIAENVVSENVLYLKENIDHALGGVDLGVDDVAGAKNSIDLEFAKRLMNLLTLGDLQHQFANHLLGHGYIDDLACLGVGNAEKSSNDGDMELF